MDERRAHPRHALRFPVEATLPADGGEVRMQARNLSMGGLYCTSPVGCGALTRLELRLLLPSKRAEGEIERLEVGAVVVRCVEQAGAGEGERYQIAILFSELAGGPREQLERYLTAGPNE